MCHFVGFFIFFFCCGDVLFHDVNGTVFDLGGPCVETTYPKHDLTRIFTHNAYSSDVKDKKKGGK